MITNRNAIENACFDVTTEPIYGTTESGLAVALPGIEDWRAVVRKEDRQVLGVSTTKYGILPNKDAFNMVFDAIDQIGLDASLIDVSVNGRMSRVRATLEFPSVVVDPGDGHNLRYRAVIQNSYDGSTLFGFQHGAFRLICTNGMMIGTVMEEFRRRHTENLAIGFEEVVRRFEQIVANAPGMILSSVKPFLETSPKLSAEELAVFLLNDAKIPTKYVAPFVTDNASKRLVAWWDAYNAFTDMITHDTKGKASSFRKDQLLGNVHGLLTRLVGQDRDQSLKQIAKLQAA